MNHDWRITAQAIQKRLLPGRRLTFGDLRCEAYYRPYQVIGGDYYDFVCLDRRRVGLAIGDVSGKGVGAALMMANLQASLRAQLLNEGTRPSILIGTLTDWFMTLHSPTRTQHCFMESTTVRRECLPTSMLGTILR